jgi:hypothetical protein
MYQQLPGLRFEKKLEAMTNRADRWRQDPDMVSEWPELSELLKGFSAFANAYISLLKKVPKSISRRSFVLNMGVERLLEQWSILSRACEQRRGPAEDATDGDSFPHYLSEARKSAKGYCDRWHPPEKPMKEPYLELHTPIVYFEKLYGISRAVYAPETPVLSIPLTDYNDPKRWQALAHELGHHIYWNGVDLKTSGGVHERLHDAVAEALSASASPSDSKALSRVRQWTRWLGRARLWGLWVEEVFADVVGTLLAGPAYAASAQDLEADRVDEVADLAEDDQEHPCPYLRPLIALDVLREIADHDSTDQSFKTSLPEEIKKLETRWTDFCGEATKLEHDETGLTMEVLRDNIPSIVRAILDTRVWPHDKSLWELIDFYGKKPLVFGVVTPELAALSPLSEGKPRLPTKDPPVNKTDPDSFKSLVQDLKDRVNNDPKVGGEQKPQALWSLLLGLELSETMDWHTHRYCTKRHSHGVCSGKHKHSMDGKVICCR